MVLLSPAVTDGLGNYHITLIPAGTAGSLVASYPNYSFTPPGAHCLPGPSQPA